jgi:phosphoserine phosphatase RsbU/P
MHRTLRHRAFLPCLAMTILSLASISRAQLPSSLPKPPAETPAGPFQFGSPVFLNTLPWRGHCSDDPAFASPTFDDSHWTLIQPTQFFPPPSRNSICWYRLHVTVQPGQANLGFLLQMPGANYDLLVNGHSIGGSGGMPPHPSPKWCFLPMHSIPPGLLTDGSLNIALRAWTFADTKYVVPGPHFVLRFGSIDQLALNNQVFLVNSASSFLQIMLGAAVSLFALGFFFMQRQRTEYFWLAVYGILFVVSATYSTWSMYHTQPAMLWAAISYSLSALIPLAFVQFFADFLRLRGRSLIVLRVFEIGLLLPIPFAMAAMASLIGANIAYELSIFAFLPTAFVLPVLLFLEYRRHNPEAAILLVPTGLAVGVYNLGTVVTLFGNRFHFLASLLFFRIGFATVGVYSVFLSLFWLSIGLVMLLRANRTNREQARLANELEAARGVQRLLLGDRDMNVPGFSVESIYLPAAEVGGDFFLIQPGADGSLLAVIGDVSGKGVPAALAVSAILGALRGSSLQSPAAVLAHLNRVLHRHASGFATCCVLHLSPLEMGHGTLTFANAGHIPPYHNGKALNIPGDLPLAILPEASYEESRVTFAPRDRFTLISDGVLEATNPQREMLGFERTEEISAQSAARIAETARIFGQEDDITVVSLVVNPQNVPSAKVQYESSLAEPVL